MLSSDDGECHFAQVTVSKEGGMRIASSASLTFDSSVKEFVLTISKTEEEKKELTKKGLTTKELVDVLKSAGNEASSEGKKMKSDFQTWNQSQSINRTPPPNPPTSPLTHFSVDLTNSDIRRFSRQLILPEIGVSGQIALRHAAVLVVGAGGLGCPAGVFLAAAGVGQIGIVDYDVVEISNLHRQIAHSEAYVDVAKAESLAQGESSGERW